MVQHLRPDHLLAGGVWLMFKLMQQVTVALKDGSQITGEIIGRTIQAEPRYDVKLPNGHIIQNITLHFGDNENYLINGME
jgi:hypothetical protein